MAVCLVAILATVAIPSFTNFSKDARVAVTRERLSALKAAIVGDARMVANGQYTKPGYFAQVGSLPISLNDLVLQGSNPSYNVYTKVGWNGPYVSSETGWDLDAWGTTIVYDSSARTLTSAGPDQDLATTADNIVVNF
jgi:type II secretory pathway pseudopilin PulG